MTAKSAPVWAKVVELGAYDGGGRLLVRLIPEETGPTVRLELDNSQPDLIAALALGVRVLCRTVARVTRQGPMQIAVAVEAVERRVGFERWTEVWRALESADSATLDEEAPAAPPVPPPPRVEETRLDSGAVRRRRHRPGD